MNEKPEKRVYSPEVQNRIYDVSKKAVMSIVNKNPEIYLANAFGSIVRKDLGIYDKPYKNKRYGSDVDVVCVANPNFKVPKNWNFVKNYKAFDEYDVDAVEKYLPDLGHKDLPIHPIKFLVYVPGVHDYEDAKKWTGIDKEASEKKGEPVEEWYKNQEELDNVLVS